VREELAQQIQQKEYLRQRDYENRLAYERDEQPDYQQYQNQAYGKKTTNLPTSGEKLDIFGNPVYVAGKITNAKENIALDIFGNPSRQSSQKGAKPLSYELDIFGNARKGR
jgi:type II secretory pathway pseudopilin PulG